MGYWVFNVKIDSFLGKRKSIVRYKLFSSEYSEIFISIVLDTVQIISCLFPK